jgi:hypothetical protein
MIDTKVCNNVLEVIWVHKGHEFIRDLYHIDSRFNTCIICKIRITLLDTADPNYWMDKGYYTDIYSLPTCNEYIIKNIIE